MDKEIPAVTDEEGNETEAAKVEDEVVNSASAMWTKSKDELDDAAYNEFYKHVGHDFQDPLAHVHSKVEGTNEYTMLLYVPARAPFDLWDRDAKHGIKLYVRKVFIMDDAEQLMPRYLRFVRGVIDTDSLPLNVSREILQQSKKLMSSKRVLLRRFLVYLKALLKMIRKICKFLV